MDFLKLNFAWINFGGLIPYLDFLIWFSFAAKPRNFIHVM